MRTNSVELIPYRMKMSTRIILVVLIALGALALNLTFAADPISGWFSVLVGSVLFLGFGLCGLFFTAIQHLTSAKWSVGLRRVMEAMALTLPVAAILIGIVYYGHHSLYEWSHGDVVSKDALLQHKAPYLNSHAFGVRLITYFVIWILATLLLVRNSFKQDQSGDAQLTLKNRNLSAPILVLFALSVTMASIDLLKSLEPHWFSTMWGIYFFAGFFQAGLAMIYVLAYGLVRAGVLQKVVTPDHLHDQSRFVFGFSVFWAYIAFSQFLLIWYADLYEETFFFIERMKGMWGVLGLVLLVSRFVIPFLVLMPFGWKRNPKVVLPVCAVIFFGQWLDLYWVTHPAMRLMHHGAEHGPHLDFGSLGSALGFLALFLLVAGFIMERIRMIPVRDPRLEESIHYYHPHE